MEDIQFTNNNAIIVGASGLGRELVSWNKATANTMYNMIGFLDDNPDALNNFTGTNLPSIIGKIDFSLVEHGQTVIMGISKPQTKESLFSEMIRFNVKVSPFIHKTVILGDRVVQGVGLVMCPNSLLSCDVTVGNLVFINCGSQIGHDVTIGNYTSIMANVDIGGGAVIGNNVLIGSGATILPGVRIPDNTIIGAGSVVLRSIKKSGGTYFGIPANRIF